MDGFQRRKERKKENIRRAAFELFSAYGVQKVSISEIAEKANVSQVTIYNYFGSKDGLLQDVIVDCMNKGWQEYRELVESDIAFPEMIDQFINEKTQFTGVLNPEFLQSFISNDPEIRRVVEEQFQTHGLPVLLKLIEKGKSQGYINQDISVEAILKYIHMFKEAKYRLDTLSDDPKRNLRLSRELSALFFYGLMGKPANGGRQNDQAGRQ
ncbi:TetR/AcrR family transcriptional regulator [Paenactinomyces guangxiensis]|uniref:TetR/AcrR family transcriptional regulator n=1 Tax=Paenactinomyces guangxiensis TaxID=1490290 RepID=A0A7W1WUE9_9BACL|nr:TetR/AcrR family transcriptional regulator [Paenactinomyces guangxiensis]MBA4496222.1 TetR/AcrR family transcriptional regulator [Paenactinomyces guangxiensis]MBH8593311.1 TetR/AcrR family transcriptional regulator [Paenactinomyces guangxiensis]